MSERRGARGRGIIYRDGLLGVALGKRAVRGGSMWVVGDELAWNSMAFAHTALHLSHAEEWRVMEKDILVFNHFLCVKR